MQLAGVTEEEDEVWEGVPLDGKEVRSGEGMGDVDNEEEGCSWE